jgi:DNA-binding GntR family transcriptional regulator
MKQGVFNKIKPSTMKHQVVDLIRDAIIRGDLAPGEHLTEVSLCEQMAVSRAPIREALRQLELDGLVTNFPNRGCFVTEFTEQDVVEVFSMRATLECMAIEWAAPNLSADDFHALRLVIEDQRQAMVTNKLDALTKLDMRFHEYLLIKANNRRLLKAWQEQSNQCQVLMNRRFRTLSNCTPGTVISDHTAILHALEGGDTTAAIRLTKDISQRVQKELIQILHFVNHLQDNCDLGSGLMRDSFPPVTI